MNANVTKTSTGKLLVAVLAMFMIVAGAAVVLSDSTADAASVSDINSAMQKGDYTLTESLTISENETLDLNGKTLTIATGGVINMTGGTITNGTIVGSDIGYGITVTSGTVTISKISASGFTQWPVYVMSAQNSNVSITGCEFDSTNTPMKSAVYIGGVSTVAISNSTFNGEYAQGAVNLDMGGSNNRSITVTITNEAANTVSIGTCRGDITIGDSNATANVKVDANTSVTEIVMDDNNQYSGNDSVRCGVTFASAMSVDTIRGNGDVATGINEIKVANSNVNGTITGSNYVAENYATNNFEQIKALLENNTADIIEITSDIQIPDSAGKITVKADDTLIITNAEITRAGDSAYFEVLGVLETDNAYIYVPVVLDEDAEYSATNTHALTSNGILNDSTQVGFGDTLTLTGTVPDKATVSVYGSLVTSNLSVEGKIVSYAGSDITADGTITVSGKFIMNDSDMELAGTITVRNDQNGDAAFTLSGESTMTVLENGTFNVNRATGNGAQPNTLTVGADATFTVEGTLNITGTLNGAIQDKGTISFYGTAGTDAKIVVYDGVTLSVTSVDGTMTVCDDKAIIADYTGITDETEFADVKYSVGNSVVLNNVRGVTVSVAVTEDKYDLAGEEKKATVYTSEMTVIGTVSKTTAANSGSIIITGIETEVTGLKEDLEVMGSMTVGDMSLGRNLAVTFDGIVEIAGTFNANISESSRDGGITLTNNADLTVSGTMIIGEGVTETLNTTSINAVFYSVTSTGEGVAVTDYYTNFANAIAAIGDADDDRILVYGEVTIDASAEIANGMTVQVQKGATLIIDSDVTLTVADGGVLDVTNGSSEPKAVDVNGVLVITNNGTGLVGNARYIDYDVLKSVGNTDTYSSLAYALSVAQPGEKIVLSKEVILETDTTIPEGVTLETGKNKVTLEKEVTLTVDGTFTVNGGEVKRNGSGKEIATVVVNGVMSMNGTDAMQNLQNLKIAGAYFEIRNVAYVTNVAYAAENVDDGDITIMGKVSFGDVTFTEKNNGDLTVTVRNIDATEDGATVVTAGTVTLDGAQFLIETGTVTATISAAANGGTATISLDKVEAESADVPAHFESTSVETDEGEVDVLYIARTINAGTVTVETGTVTVGTTVTSKTSALYINSDNSAKKTGAIVVADGATLDVPKDAQITVRADLKNEKTVMTVDGTLDVDGTVTIVGAVLVAGTANVNDNATMNVNGALTVTGTVSVSETEDKEGVIKVTKVLTIGEKPTTLGAAGAITGAVEIDGIGYIRAYAGADLSAAKINWVNEESDAVDTVFNINGTVYMTVYAAADDKVTIQTVLNAEEFELVGYDVGLKGDNSLSAKQKILYLDTNWFTADTMLANQKVASGSCIGTEANASIYAAVEASYVKGTISEGTGLDLYIDNVRYSYENFVNGLQVGTHTVSFEVTAGYDGSNAKITFNGQTVENGGTITIEAGATSFTLVANGAVPATSVSGGSTSGGDDGMGLTDYLLIILVVLIVIMAIMVAMRLMRS